MTQRHTPARTISGALLLTAVLAACGTTPNDTPAAADAARASTVLTAADALPARHAYLHIVRLPPTVRAADVAARRGGVVVLENHGGVAVIASNARVPQPYDTAVLLNERRYGIAGTTETAGKFGAWATGKFGAWATGKFGAWATGTANTEQPTTFTDNARAWQQISLGGAQTAAPTLGQGVKVAVIDTGIDLTHPALQGRVDLVAARDYIDGDHVPQEENAATDGTYSGGYGHGTAVAGVLVQVAPNVTILPIRALDAHGMGDTATIASAVQHAVASGAHVINLSLGSADDDPVLTLALDRAVERGVSVVVAAGNTGGAVLYPAAHAAGRGRLAEGVVSVGSVNANGFKSSFSAFGTGLEVEAPGEDVRTLFPDAATVGATGTSFAAPVTAGVVALARGTRGSIDNAAALSAFMTKLNQTASTPTDPTYKSQLGFGTVHAQKFTSQTR